MITFKFDCSLLNLSFTITQNDIVYTYNPSQFTNGVCAQTIVTTYPNCLTEEEMDSLAHKIMHECDICDCQLNQE